MENNKKATRTNEPAIIEGFAKRYAYALLLCLPILFLVLFSFPKKPLQGVPVTIETLCQEREDFEKKIPLERFFHSPWVARYPAMKRFEAYDHVYARNSFWDGKTVIVEGNYLSRPQILESGSNASDRAYQYMKPAPGLDLSYSISFADKTPRAL